MLGKLLKYELRPGARLLLPLYGSVIAMAGLTNLSFRFLSETIALNFLTGVITLGYVLLIFATFVITQIFLVQRFYKSLLGDEGYLMFTLPVGIDTHIAVKLLSSIIWTVLGAAAALLSFAALAIDQLYRLPELVATIISELARIGIDLPVAQIALTTFFSLTSFTLMVYASIVIGHLFHGHKLLGSFLAYFCLNIAMQTIIGVLYTVPLAMRLSGGYASDSIALTEMMNLALISSIAFSVVYYFVIRVILKHRLNLE
jgi:hypothetical protein